MATREALVHQAEIATRLEGQACTQVSVGVHHSLILDFGELQPAEGDQLSGELILAIDCPWRIDAPDVPVVGWEDADEDIADLATVLIGAVVTEVEIRRPGFDLFLQFSNDHRLRIFPDCRAYYHDELASGALPWQIGGRALTESLRES